MSADLRPLPATPLDAIDKTVTDAVIVEGRTFLIERPDASDRLLKSQVALFRHHEF